MEIKTNAERLEGWQERLASDKQGDALRELRNYLASERAGLRHLLDAGSSPEEYDLHQKLLKAVDAADSAALLFWEKFNKD